MIEPTNQNPTPEAESAEHAGPPGAAGPAPRRSSRVLAVLSLSFAFAATAVVLGTAASPSVQGPVESATAGAWEASGELSDALRALRPGATREPARAPARAAAAAVTAAQKRLADLDLPIEQTPVRLRVISALAAQESWIDAVGSTLANPRSARRAELAQLAERASVAVALVEGDVPAAADSVGGTGRLLSATKP